MSEPDTPEELPIDKTYDIGVDIDFEEGLYDHIAHEWNPVTDVDWDRSIALDLDERKLAAFLATEFHYDNMFELMLCGRLLEQIGDPYGQIVAVMLAESKVRNAGAWGKYLDKLGETADLSRAKRKYFGSLYEEDNMTIVLLGISVIGDVSWYAFMDKVGERLDPTFCDIVGNIREQKRGQITHTVNYLQNAIEELGGQERERLMEETVFFRESMVDILRTRDHLLEPLDKDVADIASHVTEYIDTFYTRLDIHPR